MGLVNVREKCNFMLRNIKTAKERGNIAVNVELSFSLHREASITAKQRGISLRQLIINGLKLALNKDDTIIIDSYGEVSNDLRGFLAKN